MFDTGVRSLDALELVDGKDGAIVLRHRVTAMLAVPTGRPAWSGLMPGIIGRHLRDGLIEPDPDGTVDEVPEAAASNTDKADWQRLRLTAAGRAWLRHCRAAGSQVVILTLPKPTGTLVHENALGGQCPPDTAWAAGSQHGKVVTILERGPNGTIDAAIAPELPGQPHTVMLSGACREWTREVALALLAATLHETPDHEQ